MLSSSGESESRGCHAANSQDKEGGHGSRLQERMMTTVRSRGESVTVDMLDERKKNMVGVANLSTTDFTTT